jgi:SMI1/KNR4 family protein SUKH-1
MKQFAQALTELVNKWQAAGTVVGEGASGADIRSFEAKFNVELPDDVRAYLKRVDGMASRDYPEDLIRFWQLNEFECARASEGQGAVFVGWLVFADFLIDSHFYAFRAGRSSAGEVAIGGGEELLPVASSFAEFIDHYLHDPMKLFLKA